MGSGQTASERGEVMHGEGTVSGVSGGQPDAHVRSAERKRESSGRPRAAGEVVAGRVSRPASQPDLPDDDELPLERYLDREESWLRFNQRVLELAEDESLQLLERVRFLAIFANNLDEYFQVRVAGRMRRMAAGLPVEQASGRSPAQILANTLASSARSRSRPMKLFGSAGKLPLSRAVADCMAPLGSALLKWVASRVPTYPVRPQRRGHYSASTKTPMASVYRTRP